MNWGVNALMKTNITLYLTARLFLSWAAAASADVLELKNGQVLTGKYTGGTTATIRFETSAGPRSSKPAGPSH